MLFSQRIRQNGKSQNKSEHRSYVLIIIIGYRRLARSIFDVQDLDIVLKCKTLKCRLRRIQRKDDKGGRHSYPDAVEIQDSEPRYYRRNIYSLLEAVEAVCRSPKGTDPPLSFEIRNQSFCLIKNYDQLAYILCRYYSCILYS